MQVVSHVSATEFDFRNGVFFSVCSSRSRRKDCAKFLAFRGRCIEKPSFLKSKKVPSNIPLKTRICETKSSVLQGNCLERVLQTLESASEIEKALGPCLKCLSAKDQSIILKKQRDWKKATEIFLLFKEKNKHKTTVIHYNIILDILGTANQWNQLTVIWKEMMKANVTPSRATYAVLIHAYGKAGLREEALLSLGCMLSQGFWPEDITISRVVHFLKKAREFQKAENILQEWSSGTLIPQHVISCSSSTLENGLQNELKKVLSSSTGYPANRSFMRNLYIEVNALPHFSESLLKRNNLRSEFKDKCMDSLAGRHKTTPQCCYTFNVLIDTYAKAGQIKRSFAVFCKMLKQGITPNTVTFNTLIHNCGFCGDLCEAEAFVTRMQDFSCRPDTRTYNILIALYMKNNHVDKALLYFGRMKRDGLAPNIVTYRTLLSALCSRHMVCEVESLLEDMNGIGVQVDEYSQTSVMRMYLDEGLLDKGWTWFQRFHWVGDMSCECYAANIDAYGERGYWEQAQKVFDCVMERRKSYSTLEFNVMIKAYGIAGLPQKALNLFRTMEAQGVRPDQFTFSTIVQVCAGALPLDELKLSLARMQQAGFQPNSKLFAALISGYGKLGKAREAEQIYQWMMDTEVQPDVSVFGALINASAKAGCGLKATHYFQEMQKFGISGNSSVYHSLIKAHAKAGLLENAQEAYKTMNKFGIEPDVFTCNCMIDLYTRGGMIMEALDVFAFLKKRGRANEFAFALMISLYRTNGFLNEAIELAKEMFKLGCINDVLSYNNIISLFLDDGRLKAAAKVFQHMLKQNVTPNTMTYKLLRRILTKGKLPVEAIEQLDAAWRSGLPQCIRAFTMTIYSIVGMHVEALNLYESEQFSGINKDIIYYNAVIYAFASANKIHEALQIFMSMQSGTVKPDLVTYMNIIAGLGAWGHVEVIPRVLSQMKRMGVMPNEFVFDTIINTCKCRQRYDLERIFEIERSNYLNFA